MLNSNVPPTSHNMVNVGQLAAEIGLPVWGTPANFNRFRVLAALLHGTLNIFLRHCVVYFQTGNVYCAFVDASTAFHKVLHKGLFLKLLNNNSSAIAEMGDLCHNRHGPKRGGLLCPFRGEL